MRKHGFFYKLLFSFIAISIIPLIMIGSIAYVWLTRTIMDTVSRQAYNNVVKISENIDGLIARYSEIVISILTYDERIRDVLTGKDTAAYPALCQKVSVLAERENIALYIVNSQGTVTCVFPKPLPRFYNPALNRNQAIFKQAAALKNGCIIYPHRYVNTSGEIVVCSIARALRNKSDQPIGYIIIEVFKSHLEQIASNINANLNLDLLVTDERCVTIADIRNPKYDGQMFRSGRNRRIAKMGTGFFIAPFHGKQSLIAFHTSKYTRFLTVGILPVKPILESSDFIRLITLLAGLFSLIVCLLLALLLARGISRPIDTLVESMKRVESGDLDVRVEFNRGDELGLLGRSFNRMVARIGELLDNIVAKQRQLRTSEIRALQAQINPHFLYNTLDSIKWLAKLNHVPQISVIVTQLGKLLRSSMDNQDDLMTVDESIVNIQSYLAIQRIRYSDKFETTFDIDPEILPYRIPKLILQPIVENAIIHGFENKPDKGNLVIRGWMELGDLYLQVEDDGLGMPLERAAALNAGQDLRSSQSAHNIGVQNVNRRIQLYYGPGYRLTVQSELGRGATVTLRMSTRVESDNQTNTDQMR